MVSNCVQQVRARVCFDRPCTPPETYTLTKVRIYSPETLELTVTKSCLEVFQDLGVAFNEALKEEFTPPTITAPYSIQNDCGFDIVLNLREGSFHLHASHLPSAQAAVAQKRFVFKSSSAAAVPVRAEDVTEVTIPAGDSAYLELKAPDALPIASQTQPIDSTLLVQQEKFVHVQVGEITKTLKIPVHKSDRRYFPLYRDTQAEAWGIVSQVRLETGTTVLTLQGVVQITNHFATTIFVHRKRNDQFEQIHAIPPNSTFNVPLHTIYNTHRDWHFSLANYKPSVQGVYWKESPTDFGFKKVLHCDPEVSYEPFYIHVSRALGVGPRRPCFRLPTVCLPPSPRSFARGRSCTLSTARPTKWRACATGSICGRGSPSGTRCPSPSSSRSRAAASPRTTRPASCGHRRSRTCRWRPMRATTRGATTSRTSWTAERRWWAPASNCTCRP